MKISSPAVQEELERVLESRCFRSRRAAQKFLGYIVKKTVAGQGKDINQHSIAIEGLGKDIDFDPSSNPLIRVQAGRLRKQLEEYYAGEGRENLVRIMLPVGSYQPAFMHRDEHQKFNVYAGKPRSPGTSKGPGLICVPRVFTQNNTAGWATSTRLTRDFVISLTQFNCCQILFADENKSEHETWPDAAWSEYEADFALLFDLHDDDAGYNLKCSLAHSQTRQIVWAEKFALGKHYPTPDELQKIFKRIANDTISLEQGVAHDAWARHLLDTKNPIQPQHHAMLALRQTIWDMTPETLQDAEQVCRQRMETFPRDVQNLVAYAELFRIAFLVKPHKFDSSRATRNHLATRLMRLAPGNAATHMLQAFVHLLDGQLEACHNSLTRSLQINPLDSHLQIIAGMFYAAEGDWDECLALVQAGMSHSKVYPDWYHIPLALNHYRLGQYQQAAQASEHIRTNTFWGPLLRAVFYQKLKVEHLALQEWEKLTTIHPNYKHDKFTYFESLPTPGQTLIEQLLAEIP